MFDFFQKLNHKATNLYFSNLRFKLKNDCACRLISEKIPFISFTSILLYDSKLDKLANYGNYINPDVVGELLDVEAIKNKKMLELISFYEYYAVRYETNTLELIDYEDFQSFHYFQNKNIFTQSQFDELITIFEAKNGDGKPIELERYRNYKKSVSIQDTYELKDPNTPSGKYFNDLITHNINSADLNHRILYSTDIDNKTKKLLDIYSEELNIYVNPNKIYLVIPLYFNNRYIGLIRTLWNDNGLSEPIEKFLERELDEILNIVGMITPLIDIGYATHEFKQISYNKLHKLFGNEEGFYSSIKPKSSYPNMLSEFCETLCRKINCRCCIIRYGSTTSSHPFIKGWTNTVQKYIEDRFFDDHFKENTELLDSLFGTTRIKNGREIVIIGVQFDIGVNGLKQIRYLYFAEDEVLSSMPEAELTGENSDAIRSIFKETVYRSHTKIKIRKILIIKIPFIENGYITFGNTVNRPFAQTDIENVYPEIHRIGSEIHITHLTTLNERSIYLDGVAHELETPLDLAKGKAENMTNEMEKLINDKFPQDDVNRYIEKLQDAKTILPRQFLHLLSYIEQRIFLFSIENDFERKILKNDPEAKFYNMVEHIYLSIVIYRDFANSDKFKLGIYRTWKDEDKFIIRVKHNEVIFDALFYLLMDNAIKYSFPVDRRPLFIKNYSQSYEDKSEGHIWISCFSDKNKYGYIITNWGKEIPMSSKDKIFEKHFQAPNDPDFDMGSRPKKNSKVHGKGLGLYYAKQYAKLLGADIDVIQKENKKITAIVTWQRS